MLCNYKKLKKKIGIYGFAFHFSRSSAAAAASRRCAASAFPECTGISTPAPCPGPWESSSGDCQQTALFRATPTFLEMMSI